MNGDVERASTGDGDVVESEVFESERLVVRDIELGDAERLARYDARNVDRFARFAPERTLGAQARLAQLEQRLRERRSGIARQFIVAAKAPFVCNALDGAAPDRDEMIGLVTLDAICGPPDARATISYSIDGAYEGAGFAAECVRCVASIAFRRLELEALDATVYLDNVRSRRLLERCGFELVAELRDVPPGLAGLLSPHAAFTLRRAAFLDGARSSDDRHR